MFSSGKHARVSTRDPEASQQVISKLAAASAELNRISVKSTFEQADQPIADFGTAAQAARVHFGAPHLPPMHMLEEVKSLMEAGIKSINALLNANKDAWSVPQYRLIGTRLAYAKKHLPYIDKAMQKSGAPEGPSL